MCILRTGRWTDLRTDGSGSGLTYERTKRLTDGWMYLRTDGRRTYERMDGWMDLRTDDLMDGWMDLWANGLQESGRSLDEAE